MTLHKAIAEFRKLYTVKNELHPSATMLDIENFLTTKLSEEREEGKKEGAEAERERILAAIVPLFEEAKTVSQFINRSKWNEALWAVQKVITNPTNKDITV